MHSAVEDRVGEGFRDRGVSAVVGVYAVVSTDEVAGVQRANISATTAPVPVRTGG